MFSILYIPKKMGKFKKRAIEEFLTVLPGLVFFFLAFNLINYTEALMFRHEDIRAFGFLEVLIAAGIVAKILLVIDHLPIIAMFRKKPLIYDVFWKTGIYSLVTFAVRYLSILYPFVDFEEKTIDFERFWLAVEWTRFWAIQIWYVVLFLVFALGRELVRVIGKDKIRRILFGKNQLF